MRIINGKQVTSMLRNSSHVPFRDIRRKCQSNTNVWNRMIMAILSFYFVTSSSILHLKWVSLWTVQVAAFSSTCFINSKLELMDLSRQRCRFPTAPDFINCKPNIIPSLLGSSRNNDVGGYDPSEGIEVSERIKEKSNVGNPQIQVREKEFSVTSILKELAAIQQQGPQKYCILGTRHCSYLHQQIIELLYVFCN
jgi:hypothetical protein